MNNKEKKKKEKKNTYTHIMNNNYMTSGATKC